MPNQRAFQMLAAVAAASIACGAQAQNYPNRPMVEYGHPEPIALYYPEEVRTDHPDGLVSLREVAMPEKYGDAARLAAPSRRKVSSERPLRHIGT